MARRLTTAFSNDPSIGGITFDAVIEESVISTAESTDFSVEDGTVFQDHITNRPDMITMTVSVSNSPFPGASGSVINTAIGNGMSRVTPLVSSAIGVGYGVVGAATNSGSMNTRTSSAWENIFNLKTKKGVFDVQTQNLLYRNCHITSLYYKTNSDNENVIDIVIEMKAIKTYKTGLSDGQPSSDQLNEADSASQQAAPPESLGEKAKVLLNESVQSVVGLFA